eukprot:TRINITY_DN591_c0_g1_i6.p1 TRINITY_DN591_c0_g1~~TRINITY_DN591_c0_g1_i6.p1  ORF type:complete len:208 (+),score=11.68 TRINITY_DN591_c0_g1_i6:96-626(+)
MTWLNGFTFFLNYQAQFRVTILAVKAWRSRKSSSGNGLAPTATTTRSESVANTISVDLTNSGIGDPLLRKEEERFHTNTWKYGSTPIELMVSLVGIMVIQLWHRYLPHANICVPALGTVFFMLEILEETMGETNGRSPCWYLYSSIKDCVSGMVGLGRDKREPSFWAGVIAKPQVR